jgi:hypothetical protein
MAGCAADTQTYDVSVKNRSARTVTIALTKTGGPVEDHWASPEQIADRQSSASAEHGIEVVAAGRTANVSGVKGSFPSGTQAILRVYGGEPNIGEMLKLLPGSSRVDVPLQPGHNDLVVRDSPGGLTVVHVAARE